MEAPEFLKSNDHHLKFCILYEVALKKPVFDSYQTFCDAVGKDAMAYPDFEFWYHRFRLGKLDFDYDRSMDPVPKTLMDMPVNLMQKITKNLNPFEKCYFRSMNHGIKNFTDSFPTIFQSIHVTAYDHSLSWKLNGKEFECKNEYFGCTFTKPKCLNSGDETYLQKCYNKVTKTYNECYVKKSLEYLTPLFKTAKLQTDFLWFIFKIQSPELDDLLPVPFFAKSVYIVAYSFDKMVQLLSSMQAGYLELFELEFSEPIGKEHFTRVFETDQFKQAQRVRIHAVVKFDLEDLVNFKHLKKFQCGLSIVEPEDILRIRDIICTFEHLESCEMFLSTGGSIRPFAEVLEADVPVGPLKKFIHFYQNPTVNEILEITITHTFHTLIEIVKIR
ncbi:hypothetical protein B9Z55_023109 [Caenorhabditis nigoni]|uniref:F-box domain-containing protein n=1 Tax=Caenorhabditis nigoni TaxID=1611254 RepID=A0A2G5SNQ6_9PELO|nr:hypothetical protein B9Z55_023109 [Caenorhabditis nigoni]